MAKIKKAQVGVKATKDSSAYYRKEVSKAKKNLADTYSKPTPYSEMSAASNRLTKADKDLKRQANKGKKGYDADGFPIKKQKSGGKTAKMKTGGTLAPSKKSVGKTFGKLNKAKYGSKTSKKK